jgi:uridine kinase
VVTRVCSARRRAVLAALAAAVMALERDHPVRVAVDGLSAAGKSTLSDELAEVLRARTRRRIIRAQIDHFMRPIEQRLLFETHTPESYFLDSWDVRAIREELLLPLGPGGSRSYRTATTDAHGAPVAGDVHTAPEDAILVADGVFLQRPELDALWDLRIWVAVGVQESLRRGVERDQVWVGSAALAEELYRTKFLPGEQRYVREVSPADRADLVVDNQDPAAPRLYRGSNMIL